MFEPVSQQLYLRCAGGENKQILVCSLSDDVTFPPRVKRWWERACALFEFKPDGYLIDIVRDLLANPQIRSIVFDGTGAGRQVFEDFWQRKIKPSWNIEEKHLELVRQFVDLYDGDCGFHQPQQPFWPKRIRYLSK